MGPVSGLTQVVCPHGTHADLMRSAYFSGNALPTLAGSYAEADEAGEWRTYAKDNASTKYAPLDQINRDNFNDLRLAWRWSSVDDETLNANPDLWTWAYEATPIMVNGVLYTTTPLNQVVAIDPVTGQTIWQYDPETSKEGPWQWFGFVHRGVAYWEDGNEQRIFIGTNDAYLIALDAQTGNPIASFGDQGRIDLTEGLRRPVSRGQYGLTSPPVICNDVVVVGSSIDDGNRGNINIPGDVRGFDARTGEQRWTFHSVPQAGEFGVETWEEDSWTNGSHTNVWTWMSYDEELDYVYLPFSTPNNDFDGRQRPGDNLFGESLVCLDAATGERVWHFQMVHHGLWDYDLPAAPNLVDIVVDGNAIKAVAQVSKQGFVYVFDRITGEPIWPIEERPVPQSTFAGEQTSPTQPFPTKPLPFDRQGFTPDDVIDFTPELHAAALDRIEALDVTLGPLFTPPTTGSGTLAMPGTVGGASWAGAAFDPASGMFYVTSITNPIAVRPTGFAFHPGFVRGLPLTKPPYGRITAIDLNTGEHAWMSPVGNGPIDHPDLQELNLPPLGWARRSFPLATGTLLLVPQEGNNSYSARGDNSDDHPFLYAFDLKDGRLLGSLALPGNARGAPMTYMAGGKQFVVMPIGGFTNPAELLALGLDGPTAIEDFETAVSREFSLLQNYPNPFNASTTIVYQLGAATPVKLVIYTATGQKIRTLIDEDKPAGRYAARWDGTNDAGEAVASGTYLYRLSAGPFSETRQLILLK